MQPDLIHTKASCNFVLVCHVREIKLSAPNTSPRTTAYAVRVVEQPCRRRLEGWNSPKVPAPLPTPPRWQRVDMDKSFGAFKPETVSTYIISTAMTCKWSKSTLDKWLSALQWGISQNYPEEMQEQMSWKVRKLPRTAEL